MPELRTRSAGAKVTEMEYAEIEKWNAYAYSKNNPPRFIDPSGMYVTTCADGDKACAQNASDFEKARQRDLKSKDASVRATAAAYGDPGKANGITVTWGDPGDGNAGNTVVTGLHDNGDGTFSAEATVTLRADRSGAELDSSVCHEGQHIVDADGFAATVTKDGHYDLSKNLTEFQTEMNAYEITNKILGAGGQTKAFGTSGGCPCVLGGAQGPIVNPDPTIRIFLADPKNGYGVTETNPGRRQNPNITTPNPKP